MSTAILSTLCLDYGRSKIGVAVNYNFLAEPVVILRNDDRLFDHLKKLVNTYQVRQLLVGVSDGVMAEESIQFARQIAEDLDLPLELVDEAFSSSEVHEKMTWLKGKMKRKKQIDHLAASEILQKWLDNQS